MKPAQPTHIPGEETVLIGGARPGFVAAAVGFVLGPFVLISVMLVMAKPGTTFSSILWPLAVSPIAGALLVVGATEERTWYRVPVLTAITFGAFLTWRYFRRYLGLELDFVPFIFEATFSMFAWGVFVAHGIAVLILSSVSGGLFAMWAPMRRWGFNLGALVVPATLLVIYCIGRPSQLQ